MGGPDQLDSFNQWTSNKLGDNSIERAVLSDTEGTEYTNIMSDINTFVAEKIIAYILGTESLDTYDNFRSQLKQMGIDRAVEIRQAAWDRYVNR